MEKSVIGALKFKKAGMIHEMTVSPKVNQDSDECGGNSGSVEKPYGTQLNLGETLRRTSLGGFFGEKRSVFDHLVILHSHSLLLLYLLCLQRMLLQSQICLSRIWVPLVFVSQTKGLVWSFFLLAHQLDALLVNSSFEIGWEFLMQQNSPFGKMSIFCV